MDKTGIEAIGPIKKPKRNFDGAAVLSERVSACNRLVDSTISVMKRDKVFKEFEFFIQLVFD